MNSSDADRQIKQMVNFILQEAQEKANEIRIKVCFSHKFIERKMLKIPYAVVIDWTWFQFGKTNVGA